MNRTTIAAIFAILIDALVKMAALFAETVVATTVAKPAATKPATTAKTAEPAPEPEEEEELPEPEEEEELPEPEEEEEAEEPGDMFDAMDRETLRKFITTKKLGVRVMQSYTDDDIRAKIRVAVAIENDAQVVEELATPSGPAKKSVAKSVNHLPAVTAFLQKYAIDDVVGETLAELVEGILTYEFPTTDITAEEQELLNAIGAGSAIIG